MLARDAIRGFEDRCGQPGVQRRQTAMTNPRPCEKGREETLVKRDFGRLAVVVQGCAGAATSRRGLPIYRVCRTTFGPNARSD